MTTIACNRKVMAGDSRVTEGSTTHKCKTKLYRINGDIIGVTGESQDSELFVAWYKTKGDIPNLSDDFWALVLTPKGIFEYGNKCTPMEIVEDFTASGSGSAIAIGAMEAGASPKEAVRIACKRNTDTGPPVRTMRLKHAK